MIIVRLDRALAERKMTLRKLAHIINISEVNLSRFKTGTIRTIRIELLNDICKALNCQPKDILEFRWDDID